MALTGSVSDVDNVDRGRVLHRQRRRQRHRDRDDLGTFGSASATVNATISVAALGLLASGNHTIYVHGRDSLNNWGSTSFVTLNLDKAGPSTTGATLTPNKTNGSVNVALSASGDDRATGGNGVTAAEYFIDPAGIPATGPAPPWRWARPHRRSA